LALCAGTTEGTCAETPYISVFLQNLGSRRRHSNQLQGQAGTLQTSASSVMTGASAGAAAASAAGSVGPSRAGELAANSAASSSATWAASDAFAPASPSLTTAAATTSSGPGAEAASGTRTTPGEAGVGGTVSSAAPARSTLTEGPVVLVRTLPFGGRRRRVISSAGPIAGSTGHFALFPRCSFGTPGGDKGNSRHSDLAALCHEPGQGRSAAEPNPEAIINAILQPWPYLRYTEGNV
jgi:hypothetical protein